MGPAADFLVRSSPHRLHDSLLCVVVGYEGERFAGERAGRPGPEGVEERAHGGAGAAGVVRRAPNRGERCPFNRPSTLAVPEAGPSGSLRQTPRRTQSLV